MRLEAVEVMNITKKQKWELYNFFKELEQDHSDFSILEKAGHSEIKIAQPIPLIITCFAKIIMFWHLTKDGDLFSIDFEKFLAMIEDSNIKKKFLFNLDLFT